MMNEVRVSQDHSTVEHIGLGSVIYSEPGVDMRVTWPPGRAGDARAAAKKAFDELMSKINDAEKEES